MTNHVQEWRRKNPEKYRAQYERAEARRRKRVYGIDPGFLSDLLARQNHACAVCGNKFEKTPHIDHDHTTGTVRGLLCFSCNAALGCLKDSAELCRAAASYLEKVKNVSGH